MCFGFEMIKLDLYTFPQHFYLSAHLILHRKYIYHATLSLFLCLSSPYIFLAISFPPPSLSRYVYFFLSFSLNLLLPVFYIPRTWLLIFLSPVLCSVYILPCPYPKYIRTSEILWKARVLGWFGAICKDI